MQPVEYAYDVVAGVSIGGLNAGLFATFPRGQERAAVEYLTEFWVENPVVDLWKSVFLNFIQGLWRETLFDTTDFLALYDASFDDIERFYRAYAVQSVDMNSGDVMTFDETAPLDVARKGLLATAAIPAFIPSVKLDGMNLVDG